MMQINDMHLPAYFFSIYIVRISSVGLFGEGGETTPLGSKMTKMCLFCYPAIPLHVPEVTCRWPVIWVLTQMKACLDADLIK